MPNPLSSITNALPLDSLLVLGFYLMAIVYIIFSAILYFHWEQYSTNKAVSKTTAILYLGSSLPLITIIGISAWLV